MNPPVIIDTENKARELLFSLMSIPCTPVGIDTETVGIDPRKESAAHCQGRIVCWSVAASGERWFIWGDFLHLFAPWLESANHFKVGHNVFGFDRHLFYNHGIDLQGIVGDTMHMSRLLYCSKMRSHGLKALAENWLGIEQPSYKSLFSRPTHGMVKERGTLGKSKRDGVPTVLGYQWSTIGTGTELIPLDRIREDYPQRLQALYDYASADAFITLLLYYEMKEQLEEKEWEWLK